MIAYHFLRLRSQTRSAIAPALTNRTEQSKTIAVAKGIDSFTLVHLGGDRVKVHGKRHTLLVQLIWEEVTAGDGFIKYRACEHNRRGFTCCPCDEANWMDCNYTLGIASAVGTASVVPEPISMVLLGSGLAGLGAVGALRRRRAQVPEA